MKVAIVNMPFGNMVLPWTGGAGAYDIWTYEVARRLAQSCEVIVYTTRGRHQKKVEYDQGVKYQRISHASDRWYIYMTYSRAADKLERIPGFRNLRRILFFRHAKHPLIASSLYCPTYTYRVAKDLKKEKCDVVHIHNFSQFVPIIRAFNPEIKIVLHMHCEWLTQIDRAIIEKRLGDVDLVIGVSQYITETIRRCFPQFAKRCQTVLNGVDTTTFVNKNDHGASKKNDVKRLLFVGRVSPEKGVHVLLDAFEKVVRRDSQVQLKIIGSQGSTRGGEDIVALSCDPKVRDLAPFYRGNYIQHLQSKLSSDLASHVSFTGSVSRRQLITSCQNADVFVFPSVWNEPFGMPIVEAMATELPVIATRGGGIPEIVEDGKTGLLVERGVASSLAEAILCLLSDEDLRESMGKAARRRAVELFSWEKTVENLLHQYRNLCEGDD